MLSMRRSVEVHRTTAASLEEDLRQILAELGLEGRRSIERR
ncbi:MAG: hypothetical protein OXH09_24475 [Gammaproteobacteria bacterium]|nr:hypothetical protein [Gammaproteobacteria bacterium]